MLMPFYEVFHWLYLIFTVVSSFFLVRESYFPSDLPTILQLLFMSSWGQ